MTIKSGDYVNPNTVIIISCDENLGEKRIGHMTFTTQDGATQILTFNQAKKDTLNIDL